MQKDIHRKMFPVYGGNCLSPKAAYNWVKKFSEELLDVADVETEVREWLREQPKDLYAAGFDALIKQWDKCIDVGGGYVEK
jgi:hypothetical protein